MGNMGIVPLNHAPGGTPCATRTNPRVGTMGTMFSCVSLVEKNEISLYMRIMLPIPPRLRALPGETFLRGYVFS